MIIAQLIDRDGEAENPAGTAYLSETPFPGDLIACADGQTRIVIRRIFLDLGPDYNDDPRTLSVRLIVRTAR